MASPRPRRPAEDLPDGDDPALVPPISEELLRPAPDPAEPHVSVEDALKRHNNTLKRFVSKYLAFPMSEEQCQEVVVFDPTIVKIEKGFLNYFANAPSTLQFDSGNELTLYQKFPVWLRSKVDSLEENTFVEWVLANSDLEDIKKGLGGPVTSSLYPTLRALLRAVKPIQNQIPQLQKTLTKIEISTAEGVKALEEIRDMTSRVEKLMKEGVKSVENVEKQGTVEEGETVVRAFIQKLEDVEKHDLSVALKQVDKLSELAYIPVAVKKRLVEMKTEIVHLKKAICTVTATWGLNKVVNPSENAKPGPDRGKSEPDPGESQPDNGKPQPDSGHVEPAPILTATVPVLPFHKIGKIERDLLQKKFLGETAYRGEMACIFNKQINPKVKVKASSAPDVCAVFKHDEIWGSKLKGDIRVMLPFMNRLDSKGAEVPVKKTSVAKLIYQHEHVCLSAMVGMHSDPTVKLGAMFGSTAPYFAKTSVSAGGRIAFRSVDGTVEGLDSGLSITNPEWGTASAIGSLLEEKRGLKLFYNHKFFDKNSIAFELDYNKGKSVVFCAGLEHQYDEAVLIKAMVRSDGEAQALVETKEAIAGSTVRASVGMNLAHPEQAPRVGFSISTNPTWG